LIRPIALAVAALFLSASPAHAVVRAGVDGQPAAPSPDPGLDHLALIAGLSGVYLGEGWVLTAGHVLNVARNQKKTDALIGGRAFPLKLDTTVRLESGADRADLVLVRIVGDPGLPPLDIVSETPAVGARLVLVGNGPLQETQLTCWDAVNVERPKSAATPFCGFKWFKTPEGKTNGVQWGTNQVAQVGAVMPGPQGAKTHVFATVFREADETPFEAQAGVGDSGGPVFVESGEGYALAGVMLVASLRNPTAATSGDRTFAADLSVYRDEIRKVMKAGS
jgi:hypothetical protein